jgi:DNA-binding NarL/FixJ family response regulator
MLWHPTVADARGGARHPHASKDGVETLREIVAQRPGLGVVMMSGFSESDATERLRGLPFTGFLHKPLEPDQLTAAIRHALLAAPQMLHVTAATGQRA